MSMAPVSTLTLLERYDRPGPRYTSYPTAIEFHPGVKDQVYVERLARLNSAGDQPLSAYIHLPFCQARCSSSSSRSRSPWRDVEGGPCPPIRKRMTDDG